MKYTTRTALASDIPKIQALIEESVRGLSINDYTQEQIEGALLSAWGLDTQLINDKTYFVVENNYLLIGCGGWSYRATLFGNDSEKDRNPDVLNPEINSAKIRAFFVKPCYARKGIGSLIMQHCEEAASAMGFRSLELMATLPGFRLYERHGFIASNAIEYPINDDLSITFIPMKKPLDMKFD
ncbi:GNAT family N-acetyltransferase [Microbulbifer spongiae]|uniref:GNAT family N-acetyltransferase n=1 Tax=Microbulbifer spongiae TaxID=2944933 RepID=A0ABY9E7K3_9GAMM|nr:GNAT family N-acetyltransferase [Microbulbifer sp. MI-G]WKD48430.1 GNAT family N-acetyltransferase [Microbulbifer sp. MI-G]